MAHKNFRDREISKREASLAAKLLTLFRWSWPTDVQERNGFLNQGCEYLDLELGETDNSQKFSFNPESAAVCFDGAQFGEVHS